MERSAIHSRIGKATNRAMPVIRWVMDAMAGTGCLIVVRSRLTGLLSFTVAYTFAGLRRGARSGCRELGSHGGIKASNARKPWIPGPGLEPTGIPEPVHGNPRGSQGTGSETPSRAAVYRRVYCKTNVKLAPLS